MAPPQVPETRHHATRLAVLPILALGVLAVSTGAIFARLADAPATAIAVWRCAIATLVLAPAGLPRLRTALAEHGLRRLGAPLLSGAFLAVHFATWIRSLEYTSVAASVFLVNTNPIWVGLLAPLVTRERVRPATLVGLVLALVGSGVIAVGGLGGGGRPLLGAFLALAGAWAASGYLLVGRRQRTGLPLSAYLFACYGSAALWLMLLAGAQGTPLVGYSDRTILVLVAMGLVPQLIGHSACNWALRKVEAVHVALTFLGEPICASLLAWLVLAEAPAPSIWIGGPLVLAGIWAGTRET